MISNRPGPSTTKSVALYWVILRSKVFFFFFASVKTNSRQQFLSQIRNPFDITTRSNSNSSTRPTHLIAERVPPDDNGLGPPWHDPRYAFENNGFAKYGAVKDITDCAIGRPPHLFKLKLFDAPLIGGNGRTLDANIVLFNCLSRFNCYAVVGLPWAKRMYNYAEN